MRFCDTRTFKEIPHCISLPTTRELGGTALGDLVSSNLWVT